MTDNLKSWNLIAQLEHRYINLLTKCLQLVYGSWTINIGSNQEWTSIFFLLADQIIAWGVQLLLSIG